MVVFAASLLKCSRFGSVSSPLTRAVFFSKQAPVSLKWGHAVSTHVGCRKATNFLHVRATSTGNPVLFRSKGPALCFHISPKDTAAQQAGHFHTSASLKALPAPFIWLVLKPLQKLMAIILGRFDFLSSQDIPDWEQTLRRAQWIIQKYSQTHGSVQMNRFFRKDSHLTCLEKMLSSLARYLEPLPDEEGDPFLIQIQALFQSDFIAKQQQEEAESLNNSPRAVDSNEFAFDQLISQDRPQEGGGEGGGGGKPDQDPSRTSSNSTQPVTETTSETNSNTVLHLGSVLSSEYNYLL